MPIHAPTIARADVVVETFADGECSFTRRDGGSRWCIETRGNHITITCDDTRGEREDASTAELLRRIATILQARPEALDG